MLCAWLMGELVLRRGGGNQSQQDAHRPALPRVVGAWGLGGHVGITSPGPLGPEREALAGPLTNEEAEVREL